MRLRHLVLDYNGTLAVDGRPLPGAKRRLAVLGTRLSIHVLTADTFGKARAGLKDMDCKLVVLGGAAQDRTKAAYVRRLGASGVVCVGNGRNDRMMLRVAALGIAVIQQEGGAAEAILASDVVVNRVNDALDLLVRPLRLVATLRA